MYDDHPMFAPLVTDQFDYGTRRNSSRAWAAIILIPTLFVFFLSGCSKPSTDAGGPLEKMRITVTTIALSAPVYVAMDRGYFKQEGLDVSIQDSLTGTDALQTVVEGKADMATCAETPVVLNVMEGRKIYIIATIADSETLDAIVGRKDRGIFKPADLGGKVIGVPPVTNIEYFLDTFLLYHGIPKAKTRIVHMKVDELNQALLEGKVDAVCTWEPHLSKLQEKLGTNGQAFYSEGTYRLTWHIVAMQDFVKKNPGAVKKMLRALIRANAFIIEHPDSAQQITANYLRVDRAPVATPWKGYNFSVTLSQSTLISLGDQARWVMQSRGAKRTNIPDYLGVFYLEGLKSIDPTLVSVEN